MRIYIGADHAGYELKEKLKKFLSELGHEVNDKGASRYDPEDDYPDFVRPTAEAVANDPEVSRGVIIGGSGQGEAMVANRVRGVRAAVFYGLPCETLVKQGGDFKIVRLSRAHNNANILVLGARFIDEETAKKAVELWLETPFDAGRHQRRIEKIDS